MAEAQLRIRPTVAGSARSAVSRDLSALKRVDREQQRAISRGVRGARRLERGWDGVAAAGRRTVGVVSDIGRNMLSLRNLATGVLAGAGAKTILDMVIGSNAKLEQQRVTFRTMMGDVAKADALMARLRENAARTPFAEDEVIDASRRLLRLTRGNVNENLRLLKVAQEMAAINPDKTVTDAAEALLDAETGEFERLKEFGIKLTKSDLKKNKKAGEELGQAALRGVNEALQGMTGGRSVVEAQAKTFEGRMSTLKDNIRNELRGLGEDGFEEAKVALTELDESIREILADPQFRGDMDALASSVLDMAKGATDLARELPQALRDFRAFVSENKTLLKLGGSALAANTLTGGVLGRGAASVVGAGARRALFGKRGGGSGAAGALSGAAGGAIPVYVVNMGGGMAEGFLGRNSAVLGKQGAKRFGTAALLKSGGLAGAASSVGVGGALGLLGIPATFGAAFLTLQHAAEGTSSALEKLNAEADRRERGQGGSVQRRAERARREALAAQRAGVRTSLTGGFRSGIDEAILERDQTRKRQLVEQAVGATTQRLKSAQSRQEREAILSAINEEVAGYGVEAQYTGGRVRFSPDEDAANPRLKARGDIFSRELNSARPQFNITMVPTGDPQADGQAAGDAAWKQWEKMQKEAARKEAQLQ